MAESVFNPDEFIRGFSNDQIAEHLIDTLRIVKRVEEEEGIPLDLYPAVFGVANAMRSSMQLKTGSAPSKIYAPTVGEVDRLKVV